VVSVVEKRPIHVLVVDDSAVVREVLSGLLGLEPGMVVATASDPMIALTKMNHHRPDVILLDLELPRMDGLTFLKKIMRQDPIPVVVCSAHTGPQTGLGLRALEEGAVEIITKPRTAVREFLHESAVLLTDAVRAAACSRPKKSWPAPQMAGTAALSPETEVSRISEFKGATAAETVIALGASTGGTEALKRILEAMPADAPALVIVQHMPEGFTAAFADRLNRSCRIAVKEAVHGDQLAAGRALIAPGNRHLLVRRHGSLYSVEVNDGPLVSRHRPSVDRLFRSVARSAGANAVGVLLTGMGSDGADGLLAMRKAGAFTLAQDEASSVVFGMPKEAIERGAADKIASLSHMADEILRAAVEKQCAAAPLGQARAAWR
jgi:two-component system, chemotaxis family, protein-glutamate methylesterase/glutaminase